MLIEGVFSLCLHLVMGGKGTLWGLFIEALIPFMRTPPHDRSTSQRSHLVYHHLWGLGLQHIVLGEDTNIQSIACCYHQTGCLLRAISILPGAL